MNIDPKKIAEIIKKCPSRDDMLFRKVGRVILKEDLVPKLADYFEEEAGKIYSWDEEKAETFESGSTFNKTQFLNDCGVEK